MFSLQRGLTTSRTCCLSNKDGMNKQQQPADGTPPRGRRTTRSHPEIETVIQGLQFSIYLSLFIIKSPQLFNCLKKRIRTTWLWIRHDGMCTDETTLQQAPSPPHAAALNTRNDSFPVVVMEAQEMLFSNQKVSQTK